MKKLLSLAMALVMGLSMGAPVLAVNAAEEVPKDWTEIKVEKKIDLTNTGTVNPAETFKFVVGEGVVTGTGVTDTGVKAPAIGEFSISFDQGKVASSTDLKLPEFDHVGVYTYKISETAGNTAGMRYNTDAYKLQVTVLNDGNGGFTRVVTIVDGNDVKTDTILNTFEAGKLVVTKEITGNFSQSDDTFEVTVTLTADEGKNLKEGPITVTGAAGQTGSVVKNDDRTVTVTFTVTHNSTVTIANVPYDVSYKVTEDAGDYTATITGDTGKIAKAEQEVEIVNNLDQEVATGVNLDNLPYILVLALVGVGLISFTVRKRVRN